MCLKSATVQNLISQNITGRRHSVFPMITSYTASLSRMGTGGSAASQNESRVVLRVVSVPSTSARSHKGGRGS